LKPSAPTWHALGPTLIRDPHRMHDLLSYQLISGAVTGWGLLQGQTMAELSILTPIWANLAIGPWVTMPPLISVTSANIACGFHAGDPDVMGSHHATGGMKGASASASDG
jgi:hypothetical protein